MAGTSPAMTINCVGKGANRTPSASRTGSAVHAPSDLIAHQSGKQSEDRISPCHARARRRSFASRRSPGYPRSCLLREERGWPERPRTSPAMTVDCKCICTRRIPFRVAGCSFRFRSRGACQGRRERRENQREQETPAEIELSIKGKAYLAGIYEHPTRHAPDKSTPQLHAEVAKGALEDAGLTKADVDGYFCAGDAPGGVMAMVDYLGLKVRHFDSTDTGGCSYLVHLGHAAEAIAAGKCSIVLITLAGKPRTGAMPPRATGAELDFEAAYGATTHNIYGMCAMRHMHEFGTTSEQLAWIKVAASHHAQYNPHA